MPTRQRSASALLLALIAPYAAAQSAPPGTPPPAAQSADLRYVGTTWRLGVGYDTDNKARGDAYWVFHEDDRSAWIGELWASQHSAGGGQVSFQWQPEAGGRDAGVRKAFAAIDQNSTHDRKVTVGAGYESPRWFAAGYASAAVTGRRQTGFDSETTTQTTTGTDNGRPYEQDIFTTTRTLQYERAYDYGVGARAGHFYEPALLRLELGVDYEWGKSASRQGTLTLGLEKFFEGSPVSVALAAEAYRQTGDFQQTKNDERLTVMVRYAFGGPAFRPAQQYRAVRVDVPAPPLATAPAAAPAEPAKPRVEKRLVKTTATMASDAFFDLDSAALRPEARAALDKAIAAIKAASFEGNIRIVGHTCDLGAAAHNQKLSERRAETVRAYLIAGGLPADRLLAVGAGMREPRFANDAAGRPKNRRVDIEFVAVAQKEEEVVVPGVAASPAPAPAPAPRAPTVEWRQEPIDTEPAWLRRALHNPPGHKQYVDTYKTQDTTTTVVAGEKRYLNRPPVAANDAFTVNADSSANSLDVLANDTDPDGDTLKIVSVGAPSHGTAVVSGAKIAYTPQPGYVGADAFTYTVADAKGLTSTAGVAITVARANHPPVAKDDYAAAGFNQPVTIDVLANDSDPDGDPLTVASYTQPANGTVTRGDGNKLVYGSKLNWIGHDTFTYTVSDGKGGTATATVFVYADP